MGLVNYRKLERRANICSNKSKNSAGNQVGVLYESLSWEGVHFCWFSLILCHCAIVPTLIPSVSICHVLTHRLLLLRIVGVATRGGALGYVLRFQRAAMPVSICVARARLSRRSYVAVTYQPAWLQWLSKLCLLWLSLGPGYYPMDRCQNIVNIVNSFKDVILYYIMFMCVRGGWLTAHVSAAPLLLIIMIHYQIYQLRF